jgi:type VI secretion system (T6SS) baseplate-like injector VgrG
MSNKKYFGKYRGMVSDINDPMMRGRIKVKVPDVVGEQESWALPCLPVGFFALPTVNAAVWIEFERGDPDCPIWSGCYWDSQAKISPGFSLPYNKTMLVTEAGNKIILDDTVGTVGISLETSSGEKIRVGETGIEIENGKGARIKLFGPIVQINEGALEVT